MQPRTPYTRFIAAGSLTAALTLLATVPFNMGGCSSNGNSGGGAFNPGNPFSITNFAPTVPIGSGQSINTGTAAQGLVQAGQAFSLTPRQENAMGQSVSLALTNKYGVMNDDRLNRYVMLVGTTVSLGTPMGSRPWLFGVLNTDDVNAFSAPGRYVFITRGALANMQDESELAGVLAHEIGHVNAHHGLDIVRNAGLLKAGQTIGQSLSQEAQFDQFADFSVKFLTENAFSQPQEFEADSLGARYSAAAGYDPNGLVRFLQRVQSKQKQGFKLMSTHPGIGDRIRRLSDQISAAGTGGKGATLKDRFEQSTRRNPQSASAQ